MLGVLGIALVITIAVLAGLAAVVPAEGAGSVGVMVARLVDAAAAVACVLLVIDGVLDV